MSDSLTACACAHMRLVHVEKRYFGGQQSEHWECESCGVRFVPDRGPPVSKMDRTPYDAKGHAERYP